VTTYQWCDTRKRERKKRAEILNKSDWGHKRVRISDWFCFIFVFVVWEFVVNKAEKMESHVFFERKGKERNE